MPKVSKKSNFNKKQSKEIDNAIKTFERQIKLADSKFKESENFLINVWVSLSTCCDTIIKNENGISHIDDEKNKKGLLPFANQMCSTYEKTKNKINNDKFSSDLKKDGELVGVVHIINFLRSASKYKMSGSRVNKLIDCCNKILRINSKRQRTNVGDRYHGSDQRSDNIENKHNYNMKPVVDCLKQANSDLANSCKKLSDKDQEKSNKSMKDFAISMANAFDFLCNLAERDNKFSSKSTKGLAGWYNDHKKICSSVSNSTKQYFDDVIEAIFDITEDKYVKGTGFLGINRSRLIDVVGEVEKLKKLKNKYEEMINNH